MYGWGKGAASHPTLVVSPFDWGKAWKSPDSSRGHICSRSAAGPASVPSALLLYLHCKDASIGGWAVRATQQETVALTCHVWLGMCACMCARAWARKGSSIFAFFLPSPPPLLRRCSVEMQKAFCCTLLCHSLQTHFPGRAVLQKGTEGNKHLFLYVEELFLTRQRKIGSICAYVQMVPLAVTFVWSYHTCLDGFSLPTASWM